MRYTMCYSLIYIKGLRTILRANTLPQPFQNLIKRIEFSFWHPSNEDFVNITWVDKKVHLLIRFRLSDYKYENVFAFIQSTLRIMCTYYMQYITTIITYGHRFSKIVNGGTTLYRTCCIENRFTRVFPMILQYLVLINLTSSYLCLAIIHCPKKRPLL